ncbi:hypothetical protein PspLS_03928 [Pyricularia sp. CBS 133598]|nr:hypothetical protein PspLS_03928 [Pyricularia sp. CBS 133598]
MSKYPEQAQDVGEAGPPGSLLLRDHFFTLPGSLFVRLSPAPTSIIESPVYEDTVPTARILLKVGEYKSKVQE